MRKNIARVALVLIFILGLLLVRPVPNVAAVDIPTIGNNTQGSILSGNSKTISHNSNSNYLIVFLIIGQYGTAPTNISVTYNGTGMTAAENYNGTYYSANVYYMIDPPSGAHDVVASWSGSAATYGSLIAINVVNGKVSAAPYYYDTSTMEALNGSTLAVSSTTSTIVIDGVGSVGYTKDASQTAIGSYASWKTGSASSTNMVWTGSGRTGHAGIAIEYEADATPTSTATSTSTSTATSTATATVTETFTPTNTATVTETPVFTPTETHTPTSTATETPVISPTSTSPYVYSNVITLGSYYNTITTIVVAGLIGVLVFTILMILVIRPRGRKP